MIEPILYVRKEHSDPHEGDGKCMTIPHARKATPSEIVAVLDIGAAARAIETMALSGEQSWDYIVQTATLAIQVAAGMKHEDVEGD